MTMRANFVGDAELARAVLATQAEDFNVSNPPHFKHLLGQDNLGLLDEPRHGELRAALAPAFAPGRVADAQPRLAALAAAHVDAWAAAGSVKAWHEEIRLLALHIMTEVITGVRLDDAALQQLAKDFSAVSAGLAFPIPIELFGLTPFGKAMRGRRAVEKLLAAQVAAYRAAEAGGAPQAPSLLQEMLQARLPNGEPLSAKCLADNFVGLLIAGHDTTASSLCTALYHLAASPAALAALRAEADAVAAAHGGDGVSATALADMPYAEAVLREAWRLKPVVPVVGREAKRDIALGPFAIKAKQRTFVALNTITSGRAGAWAGASDAAAFRPERWLAGAPGAAEAAQQQMPFGAGKRMCLGAALAWAEAKTVLALVARRLDFSVDHKSASWVDFPFPQVAMDAVCAPRRR